MRQEHPGIHPGVLHRHSSWLSNTSVRGEPQLEEGEQREGSLPALERLLSHRALSVSNSFIK